MADDDWLPRRRERLNTPEKKKRPTESRKRCKSSVLNIGFENLHRWESVQNDFALPNDIAVAKFLLDHYDTHRHCAQDHTAHPKPTPERYTGQMAASYQLMTSGKIQMGVAEDPPSLWTDATTTSGQPETSLTLEDTDRWNPSAAAAAHGSSESTMPFGQETMEKEPGGDLSVTGDGTWFPGFYLDWKTDPLTALSSSSSSDVTRINRSAVDGVKIERGTADSRQRMAPLTSRRVETKVVDVDDIARKKPESRYDVEAMSSTDEETDAAATTTLTAGCEGNDGVNYKGKFSRGKSVKRNTDQLDKNDIGDKQYECDVCNKAFSRPGVLKTHMLIHSGQKPYACDVCDRAFALAGYLKAHKLVHTGDKKFECDVCSKAFTQASRLKLHMLTHNEQKQFACDVCGKAYSRPNILKTHKLIHSGEMEFACDVCNKTFSASSSLKRHKLLHTGHKQFVCDVCGRAFSESGNLKTHKLTHTGLKRFACDVCGKPFPLARDLRRHRLRHTGEKPFVCELCGKAFTRDAYLKVHRMTHQPAQLPGQDVNRANGLLTQDTGGNSELMTDVAPGDQQPDGFQEEQTNGQQTSDESLGDKQTDHQTTEGFQKH